MDDYETPARGASEVLERACALAGLVVAFTMERDYPRVAPRELPTFARDYSHLTRVYRSTPPTGLVLSPNERAILEKPLGAWSAADQLNMGWRTEGAALLGWAVGVIDTLAPYDQMVPFDWIRPLTDLTIRKRSVTLRASKDLDRALTEAANWHWRARQVEGHFRDPSVDALTDKAANRRKETMRAALRERVYLFGKPYEELTFKEWSLARSIASERHYALTWLWDEKPWDEVDTDT